MAGNMNLEDTVLKAVDILASRKIESAGFDRTIQATIVSCIDATIGKYKVKYQDSYWYAYSGNIDTSYPKDTNVYILVPGGDMTRDKTILGTSKKLGINYVTQAQGEQKYDPVGNNLINDNSVFSLCSFHPETLVLYDYNESSNLINLDIESAEEYLKKSNHIIAGASFQTDLPVQQRYQGDYGISFGLDFIDNATKKQVTRYYTVDVDKMAGNPYKTTYNKRQYGVFEIDGENFVRINNISIFTDNFPIEEAGNPNDIFISKIQLSGATDLEQENLTGCALVLLTPQGYIFKNDSTKTIQAQLRVKGKTVDENSQSLPFYWFRENTSITPKTLGYNKYGGQGWECLNKYNVIKSASGNNAASVEYIPVKGSFTINKSDVTASSIRYKCAVVYDGTVLTKEIIILNENATYDITIESNGGTQFYYDIGNPILTCKCQYNNTDVPINTLKFVWGVSNNADNFELLPTTEQYNTDCNRLNAILEGVQRELDAEWLLYQKLVNVNDIVPSDGIISGINDGTKKAAVSQVKQKFNTLGITSAIVSQLFSKYKITVNANTTYNLLLNGSKSYTNTLTKVVKNYKTVQRIENNKIFGLNVKNITNFATFKCSVFNKNSNEFIGTGIIKIINVLQGEDLYSLVINNGSQVYKYNAYGVAPTSKQNKIPYEIQTLSFTVYDNLGNAIADQVIQHSDITWIVPIKNTMLKISDSYEGEIDESGNNKIYKGLMSLEYEIAERFDVNKTNNNIELKIDYNGLNLVAKTDLTFTKEGKTGINGTDFVCKIVPNVVYGQIPENPVITYNGSGISFNWHADTNRWFKAELWHNGETPIFSGTSSATSTEGKPVKIIKWEVLQNQYYTDTETPALNKKDKTNISIGETSGICTFNAGQVPSGWSQSDYTSWRPANIIKVTLSYDNHTYYATMPVTIVYSFNSNYRISLKDRSGFQQAVFSDSGIDPAYDNHAPFELVVQESLGGDRWEDVSNKKSLDYKFNYDWYYLGSTWYREKIEQEQTETAVGLRAVNTNEENQEQEEEEEQPQYEWYENVENVSSGEKWLMSSDITQELKNCQKAVKPVDNYNGECVNTAVGCRVYKAGTGQTVGWIHIPVHMLRDNSSNSAISGWDGNSIKLRDGGGSILAPQSGAGVMDKDGKFTGIVIGTVKDPNEDTSIQLNNTNDSSQGQFAKKDEQIGLFGYHKGSRTIFLDAKTGKSIFGETKQAQIILDPTQQTEDGKKLAQIRSGDYKYKPGKVDIQGKLREPKGKGLMIDLTTPEIKYGSGNFEVNKDGKIIARGGGTIAGWEITDYAMFNIEVRDPSNLDRIIVEENFTGMNSNPIPSEDIEDLRKNGSQPRWVPLPPFKNEPTEDWLQEIQATAFWAGYDKFFVTHKGYLRAQEATIGNGATPIYIGHDYRVQDPNSAIFSGRKYLKNANIAGFYLGEDGVGIGKTRNIKIIKQNAPIDNSLYENDNPKNKIKTTYLENNPIPVSMFQVDKQGRFYATMGFIGKGIDGWEIGQDYLRHGKLNLNDNNNAGVYIGVDGLRLGSLILKANGEITGTSSSVTELGGTFILDANSEISPSAKITGTNDGSGNKRTLKTYIQNSDIEQTAKIIGTSDGSGNKKTLKAWIQQLAANAASAAELTASDIINKIKGQSITFSSTITFSGTADFTGTVKSGGTACTTATILRRSYTEDGTTKYQSGFKFSRGLYMGQYDNAKFVWKSINNITENNKTVYFLGYYMP